LVSGQQLTFAGIVEKEWKVSAGRIDQGRQPARAAGGWII
jgi:hypothetical protein